MERIHNNPKADGPRMPFIVPRHQDPLWLGQAADPMQLAALMGPYDDRALEAFTLTPLPGKQAVGNVPQALEP